jgi:hypothetical protein
LVLKHKKELGKTKHRWGGKITVYFIDTTSWCGWNCFNSRRVIGIESKIKYWLT